MAAVTIGSQTYEYPAGTPYEKIVRDRLGGEDRTVLLVSVNGRLRELHKEVKGDCSLEFVTASDPSGFLAYQRSAVFLMLKAFYDVAGKENVRKLTVCFSMGDGLYVEPEGDFSLTPELIGEVKKAMERLAARDLPLYKRSENTEDAVELFARHGMYDKEKLFTYRRASRVNIYSLENFEDYFYGYMVISTGYIRYFDLMPYDEGMILLLPSRGESQRVAAPRISRKLFEVQREAEQWGKKLGVFNVGTLNEAIAKGRTGDLILMQEALQEKKIGDLAERIAASGRRLVMIAGPSSSGKTTFSHRLSIQLSALGLRPHPISVDNYFVNRKDSPRDENGNYDYEALECIDVPKFNEDMAALLAGERIELPRYNFISGEREYQGEFLEMKKEDILVIEGIHCLNDALSYALSRSDKFKIYISALTQLNVDEHNRIPTTDGRLLRRMIRDARTRGSSARETIRMWDSVRRGEEKNIFPYQEEADVMFNSALLYELAVLKQYAEPLLYGISREEEEYPEAKRLLKFLDYFLGVSSEQIPHNSILREFIGGSCFRV